MINSQKSGKPRTRLIKIWFNPIYHRITVDRIWIKWKIGTRLKKKIKKVKRWIIFIFGFRKYGGAGLNDDRRTDGQTRLWATVIIWTMWIYYRTMAHGPWKIHELRYPIKWAGRKTDFRRQSVKLRTNWRAERRRERKRKKTRKNVCQNANNFYPTINDHYILLIFIII